METATLSDETLLTLAIVNVNKGMGCGLRTADCGLRTADCGLRTAERSRSG